MAPPVLLKSVGEGPGVLLVHGSAADHTTWTIQMASLRQQLRLVVWDRRGAPGSPLPPGVPHFSVEAHAQDAADIICSSFSGPVVACGSSFGAVVVLELARKRPELLHGMVLMEPPLRPDDAQDPVPVGFLERFDELVQTEGGPAAAEFFLRAVLGDQSFDRIPRAFRERSLSQWAQVRQDIAALQDYRVRYPELSGIHTPTLLLGGERSAPFYLPTLQALTTSLGSARLEILTGAGHTMHADVHRRFNQRLVDFVSEVIPRGPEAR